MSFFDSEVVRAEVAHIHEMQEEIYQSVWKFASFSDVEKFDSLEDIFEKYIDVEFVKGWFNIDEVKLEDVLEERNGIYVMSVDEDMSLYIFKNDSLVDLIENYVFELDKVRSV